MNGQTPQHVALFGSTGSIGTNTLDVAASLPDQIRIIALAARSRTELALEQAQQFRPRWLIITDETSAAAQDWSTLPAETTLLIGDHALNEIAAHPDVDCLVAAIVGSAGLASTWAAVAAGKRVALANKETLVMAGALVMKLAAQTGATILPVDSEHSAVFQALETGRKQDLRRIILTASGGPFRKYPIADLPNVTAAQALQHPNWSMGRKITIDSATMMNKALEIIEARWLFQIPSEQIAVVVHPQSIVHSFVEWEDGSVIAQLGPPDMRLPIQYALTYPQRLAGPARRWDWTNTAQLDWEQPDLERFPALKLGWQAAKLGGTAGAVLNAANEAAVELFLSERIKFTEITKLTQEVLAAHEYEAEPTLAKLIELDQWARQAILEQVTV
jgi:1-deoxy-D-xylulose-5-phosphate reductoisomerase